MMDCFSSRVLSLMLAQRNPTNQITHHYKDFAPLGCVDISPQADESGSEMKEAKVSGVQLLKPGEDPAVMLYFVDEAFDQMTLPV